MKIGSLVKVSDLPSWHSDPKNLRNKLGIIVDIQDGHRVQVLFGEQLTWLWNYDLKEVT
jgi:hypothetical protein